jgi:hypothetical protein
MKRVLRVLGILSVSLAAITVAKAQIVLPNQPHAAFGDSVTPSYEGWFDSPDGSHNILFGYYNRNSKQELDVPIGSDNKIEPGGPDRGQPTHFLTGRQFGVFLVTLSKDVPKTEEIVWTLTANGQQISIPAHMKPEYTIDPFEEAAVQNTPPTIRFDDHGKTVLGPLATAFDQRASVGTPLELRVWATDDNKYTSGSNARRASLGDPVRLMWAKYRGSGTVRFGESRPKFHVLSGGARLADPVSGEAATTATFDRPGEYWLQLTANDFSGPGGAASGGAACCWTNAILKVLVTN